MRLLAEPLTPLSFAAYGSVVQAPSTPGRSINEGSSERFELVDDLALGADGGRATLALFRARPRRFPHAVQALERHALGSQTFVPLGEHRFVLVVAAAGERPDASALRAFVTDGRQGAVLAPGTWHHALLAVEGGDFAVVERAADVVDCDTCALPAPVEVQLAA